MEVVYLSIILPCYNVDKFISRCLDSLYFQDIDEDSYEVICVNDCSLDKTRDVIVSYQQKHSNLRLIDHIVNKKQGEARNTGVQIAKGEYIWFIDPDDYIDNNVFKSVYNHCVNNNLDILLFNYKRLDINTNLTNVNNLVQTEVMTGGYANLFETKS